MESLALLVSIIVAPAMFGGPIALLLALWRPRGIRTKRRFAIYLLSSLSILVGLYLLAGNISRGASLVGFLGISTGAVAVWLSRKRA